MDLTAGNCGGEFSHDDGVHPSGTATAMVSAMQNRPAIRRVIDRSRVSSERWIMTPCEISICTEGREVGNASASCQVWDIDATLHVRRASSPQGGDTRPWGARSAKSVRSTRRPSTPTPSAQGTQATPTADAWLFVDEEGAAHSLRAASSKPTSASFVVRT